MYELPLASKAGVEGRTSLLCHTLLFREDVIQQDDKTHTFQGVGQNMPVLINHLSCCVPLTSVNKTEATGAKVDDGSKRSRFNAPQAKKDESTPQQLVRE